MRRSIGQLEEQGILRRNRTGPLSMPPSLSPLGDFSEGLSRLCLKTDGKTLKKSLLSSPTLTTLMLPDKKGKKPHYGYKAHSCRYTRRLYPGRSCYPAHVADTSEFENSLGKRTLPPDSLVFADKGYSSMKNQQLFEERNYIDGIMHKAVRGKTAYLRPASYEQADQKGVRLSG